MTPRCIECGRCLTAAASQRVGIGPTCLESMRARGLVVGARPRTKRPRLFAGMRQGRVWASDLQRDWVREIGA
jgi:hypothetical protein